MSSVLSWVPQVALPASAAGDADPEEVWDRYLRPARWSQWSPQVARVECAKRRIARGVTGRVFGPLRTSVDFEVTAFDASRRTWAWHVTAGPAVLGSVELGPIALDIEHRVQPYGTGSRTEVTVRGPAPAVLGYLPLTWIALRRLVSA